MPLKIKNLILLLSLQLITCQHTIWAQTTVYTITLDNKNEVDALSKLESDSGLDIWGKMTLNTPTHVMVTDQQKAAWEGFLKKFNKKPQTDVANVATHLQKEAKSLTKTNAQKRKMPGKLTWDAYYDVKQIYSWLDTVVKKYKKICTLTVIGKSHQNRPIKVLKISTGNLKGGGGKKKAVFLDGLFHAREWVTGSFVTYVINELTSKATSYKFLLDKLDFYVVPIVNPDGYAFSHADPAKNRLWRKNRAKLPNTQCIGVDLNRNFGFHWREDGDQRSNDPCSPVYAGSAAFSEPESRAIRDFILTNSKKVHWYFYYTIHSFGNCWTSSYSYQEVRPKDDADLQKVNKCGAEALEKVHGTKAKYGNSAQIMGKALAGVSDDWAKGVGGFKYAITIELRDNGTDKFILPPEQILPASEEAWAGLQMSLTECRGHT